MTRIETKLSVAIPAPVSGQSAVNVATATSKCSITFLLRYDQDGNNKGKQGKVSNILSVDIVTTRKPICWGINNETMTFCFYDISLKTFRIIWRYALYAKSCVTSTSHNLLINNGFNFEFPQSLWKTEFFVISKCKGLIFFNIRNTFNW